MGVRALNGPSKTGRVAAARVVDGDEELMMISANGIVIRTSLDSIIPKGRKTQGVTVMNLRENDRVACIEVIDGQNANGESHEDLMAPAAPSKNGKNGAS